MKIKPLGLLNQGKLVEYSGDFPIDTIDSLREFGRVNSGSILIFDDEGAEYLDGLLKGFSNIILNPRKFISRYLYHGDTLAVASLEEALSLCPEDKEIYVLAGEKLFKDALDYNLRAGR